MYIIIVIMLAVFNLFLVRISKQGYVNFSGLFILFWTICLCFASLSLYGMGELSDDVKILCIIPIPIFGISATMFPKKTIEEYDTGNNTDSKGSYAYNKLLLLLNLAIYLFSIPYLGKALSFILQGNLYLLRSVSFEGTGIYMNTMLLTVYQTFLRPLLICMIILTAMDYSRNCGKKICLVFSILNVIMFSVLFVGRYMIFESMIIVFATFYTKEKTRVLSFIKNHLKVILLGIMGVLALVFISDSRSNNSISRSLYSYFCGSFGFLNTLVNNGIGLDLHLNGAAGLGFIYNLIYLFLSVVGIVPHQGSASYQITQLTGRTMSIGPHMSYNSLATFLHTFMADFGKWGSLIEVCLFAIILNALESKRFRKNSVFLTAVYIELVYVVINCVLQYSLLSSSMGVLFIYLFFFTHSFRISNGKLYISE